MMDEMIEWFLKDVVDVYVDIIPLKGGLFHCSLWIDDTMVSDLGKSQYPLTLYQAIEQAYLENYESEEEDTYND